MLKTRHKEVRLVLSGEEGPEATDPEVVRARDCETVQVGKIGRSSAPPTAVPPSTPVSWERGGNRDLERELIGRLIELHTEHVHIVQEQHA